MTAAVLAVLGAVFFVWTGSRQSLALPQGSIMKIKGQGHPELAVDDKISTCWQAKGKEPHFTLDYSGQRPINRIDVLGGNNSSETDFTDHGRPRKMLFLFNRNIEFEVELEDTRERQVIIIPERISLKKVKVAIKTVFPGERNEAVCLTEVKFWNSPMP